MEKFKQELLSANSSELILDFCRKKIIHGTPFLFQDRDDSYYEFRKKIAYKFEVSFHEVFVVGSAKLGFNFRKETPFGLDSDVDVVILSEAVFEHYMEHIRLFQMELRESRRPLDTRQLEMYRSFLEYIALGWLRPDKLPVSCNVKPIKDDWFDFFKTLSHGRSEVGNYKVNAGIFKSYHALEQYQLSGLKAFQSSLKIKTL